MGLGPYFRGKELDTGKYNIVEILVRAEWNLNVVAEGDSISRRNSRCSSKSLFYDFQRYENTRIPLLTLTFSTFSSLKSFQATP